VGNIRRGPRTINLNSTHIQDQTKESTNGSLISQLGKGDVLELEQTTEGISL
jgi:hypothetical protein